MHGGGTGSLCPTAPLNPPLHSIPKNSNIRMPARPPPPHIAQDAAAYRPAAPLNLRFFEKTLATNLAHQQQQVGRMQQRPRGWRLHATPMPQCEHLGHVAAPRCALLLQAEQAQRTGQAYVAEPPPALMTGLRVANIYLVRKDFECVPLNQTYKQSNI